MRKVIFPFELDATEFCTDELKQKLIPVRDKIRNLRKDALDAERARKRTKKANALQAIADKAAADSAASGAAAGSSAAPIDDATIDSTMDVDETLEEKKDAAGKAAANWEKELSEVIDPEFIKDDGANVTGLYELMGLITHQGASADSGHYCSYVKKVEGDGNTWWLFNDDKVSEVGSDKIEQLSGGGK